MAMQMQIHDANIKSIIQVESVFVYTSCFVVVRFPQFLLYIYIAFFLLFYDKVQLKSAKAIQICIYMRQE